MYGRLADGTQGRTGESGIIAEVKKRCDVIVQVSTGGAAGHDAAGTSGTGDAEAREMATLSMGSVNFWWRRVREPPGRHGSVCIAKSAPRA